MQNEKTNAEVRSGDIFEFGFLANNTNVGWAYKLVKETETAKNIQGRRHRIDEKTGESLFVSGTKFRIKNDEPIDEVKFVPGYRTGDRYDVRVQADSFEQAKLKACSLYAEYLKSLALKILQNC